MSTFGALFELNLPEVESHFKSAYQKNITPIHKQHLH
jgi:hypothetical protein